MKYMTFNSSCSYAGVANLLEDYDTHIEDYELARKMKVAYIFKYDIDKDSYVSGPMLQDGKYFDYYLNKKGLKLIEKDIGQKDFIEFLRNFKRRCMVGLNFPSGKHAVIFENYNIAKETYVFLNNKREDSDEDDILELHQSELLDLLDEEVRFSYISYKQGDYLVDLDNEIKNSIEVLNRYGREVLDYVEEERSIDSLADTMDSLFRPYFIDVYLMMDIIGEVELRDLIYSLRESYLEGVRQKKTVRLSDYIDTEDMKNSIEMYKEIINKKISK